MVLTNAVDDDARQDGGHAGHGHEVSDVRRRGMVGGMTSPEHGANQVDQQAAHEKQQTRLREGRELR